jgi:hypothetical protein
MCSTDKKETMPSDKRENDSAANRHTNATALRVIIYSPSYFSIHSFLLCVTYRLDNNFAFTLVEVSQWEDRPSDG